MRGGGCGAGRGGMIFFYQVDQRTQVFFFFFFAFGAGGGSEEGTKINIHKQMFQMALLLFKENNYAN